MVLSVNSSTKAILSLTAVATLAIGTVLFYRSLGNAAEQSKGSSLANKDVSILHSIPGFSWLKNYFAPSAKDEISKKSTSSKISNLIVETKKSTENSPAQVTIGSSSRPVSSNQELLETIYPMQHDEKYGVLVIYGKTLEIDTHLILKFNPRKLILIGASIAHNSETNSLEQIMIRTDWAINEHNLVMVAKVNSIEEALTSKTYINPETKEPWRMVFSVQV